MRAIYICAYIFISNMRVILANFLEDCIPLTELREKYVNNCDLQQGC